MSQSSVACQRTAPQTSSWQRPRSTGESRVPANASSSRFSVNSPPVLRCCKTCAAICLGFCSCNNFNDDWRVMEREFDFYFMKAEFEKLAAAGKIEGRHVARSEERRVGKEG